MKTNISYQNEIAEIDKMLNALPKELENQERKVLSMIGSTLKKKVRKYIYDSNIESRAKKVQPKNYDGSRPYIHVKDDIIYTVRKDKNKNLYVSIRGGKMTGYKWHMINDGHISRDTKTYVHGSHFMEKAIADAQGEIERHINDMVKKVIT